jgi:hypothetical protein
MQALESAVREAFPDAVDPPKRPHLGVIGVTACRACGSTQSCACPSGCSWAEADLCSACADGDREEAADALGADCRPGEVLSSDVQGRNGR